MENWQMSLQSLWLKLSLVTPLLGSIASILIPFFSLTSRGTYLGNKVIFFPCRWIKIHQMWLIVLLTSSGLMVINWCKIARFSHGILFTFRNLVKVNLWWHIYRNIISLPYLEARKANLPTFAIMRQPNMKNSLSWVRELDLREATAMMIMLPQAVVSNQAACSTDFIVSGAYNNNKFMRIPGIFQKPSKKIHKKQLTSRQKYYHRTYVAWRYTDLTAGELYRY